MGPRTRAAQAAEQRQRTQPSRNPAVRAAAGESSFEPARTRPGQRTTATQAGMAHNYKQFREVDPAALARTLPPQARHLARDFVEAGRRHNIDPLTLVAISRHETANWTSSAFRNKNNAMGISDSRGPRRMASAGQSIDIMARNLANPRGYYRNANNLRSLWGVYAPGPATGQPRPRNDPRGQNASWGPGILRNLRDYERQLGIG